MLTPRSFRVRVVCLSLLCLLVLLIAPGKATGQETKLPTTCSEAELCRNRAPCSCSLIRIYQNVISPVGASSCQMHPSCSSYAYRAFQKYGFVRGVMLTSDRLMRCNPGAGPQYSLVEINGHWRLSDPLERNVWWWSNSRRESIVRRKN